MVDDLNFCIKILLAIYTLFGPLLTYLAGVSTSLKLNLRNIDVRTGGVVSRWYQDEIKANTTEETRVGAHVREYKKNFVSIGRNL